MYQKPDELKRSSELILVGATLRSHPRFLEFSSSLLRTKTAVTSTGSWSGEKIKNKRDKYARVRSALQRKSSQGTRRRRRRCRQILQRLSGRERRFQQWLDHNISKSIISSAKQTNSLVAIEDLTGIRERTNSKPRNKTEKRRSNSWAFYQLRLFLEYKGIGVGVKPTPIPSWEGRRGVGTCLH